MFFKFLQNKYLDEDAELIHRFKSSGDLEFLGRLYEKYMHLVHGVCLKYLQNREDSRDATMQIFEKLVVEIPKREIENFKSWLYVLTKNHCLMQIRAEKSRMARADNIEIDATVFMESTYELHHNNELVIDRNLTALKKCIDALKAGQQECIKLFYLEEKCYQEISELTQLDLKKVKSYIQNGKRNLKICMEQHG